MTADRPPLYRDVAEKIAAEYARLSQPETPTDGYARAGRR